MRKRMASILVTMILLLTSVMLLPFSMVYADEKSDFYISNGRAVYYRGSDKTVILPKSVRIIDRDFCVRSSMKKIKELYIPKTVKKIDARAFWGPEIETIVVEGNPKLDNDSLEDSKNIECFVAPRNSYIFKAAQNLGYTVVDSKKKRFYKTNVYLLVGDNESVPLLNHSSNVSYWSEDNSIATVTKTGTVTAHKSGETTIHATDKGEKYSFKLNIYDPTVDNRVKQIIENQTTADMNDVQKLAAIQMWFIKNVEYDWDTYRARSASSPSHTAVGCLMNKKAVCDGYAKGYQMCIDRLRIPNRIVDGYFYGEGHEWNMVQIEGAWYHIDVTGNHGARSALYYLKPTSYMQKDHTWNLSSYPDCSSTKYDNIGAGQ